jgi:hypothetical protein
MNPDELRDSLHDLADAAPPADDLWERTTMRIRHRRVARRAATAGVAALAMVALAGTVAVLADDDDVVVTPPADGGTTVPAPPSTAPTTDAPPSTASDTTAAPPGTTETVPDSVVVPSVVGLAVPNAASALQQAGFAIELDGSGDGDPVVTAQVPSPGTEAERGSTVYLVTCVGADRCQYLVLDAAKATNWLLTDLTSTPWSDVIVERSLGSDPNDAVVAVRSSLTGDHEVAGVVTDADADSAGATILVYNAADDSVTATEYRLTLVNGADGWRIDSVSERHYCTRGVDPGGAICV